MASCSVASLLPSSSTIGSAKRLSHGTTRLRNRTAIQADARRFVPGVGLTEPVGPPGLSRPQILVALPAPQGPVLKALRPSCWAPPATRRSALSISHVSADKD